MSPSGMSGAGPMAGGSLWGSVPLGLGLFPLGFDHQRANCVPCLVERKAAKIVAGDGEEPSVSQGIHCIFGHRLPRFLWPLALCLRVGWGPCRRILPASAPPRCLPGLRDGLAWEILGDGEVFMARGQSHQGAPHFTRFCVDVSWSVVLLKVVGD